MLTSAGSYLWRIGWSNSYELENKRAPNFVGSNLGNLSMECTNGHFINTGLTAILEIDSLSQDSGAIDFPFQFASHERGSRLSVCCSPYALLSPRVFLNSVSSGCVSNFVYNTTRLVDEPTISPFLQTNDSGTLKQDKSLEALILTDARCLPGSEGGLVVNEKSEWIGIVALPLSLADGSAVELNLIISNHVLLPWLYSKIYPSSKASLSIAPVLAQPDIFLAAEAAVLMVRIGSSWGTGIIISKDGYILTNAHVVRAYLTFRDNTDLKELDYNPMYPTLQPGIRLCVRVESFHFEPPIMSQNPSWVQAEVVFASTGAWDIALLKVSKLPNFRVLPIQKSFDSLFPQIAQPVFVFGFPLFAPPANLSATITQGVLSGITHLPNSLSSILYQTDISIHQGNSGGALFALNGNQLCIIGMITSNVKHSQRIKFEVDKSEKELSTIIPSLNFSIPTHCLSSIFEGIRTNSLSLFKSRLYADELLFLSLAAEPKPGIIRSIWQLREHEALKLNIPRREIPKMCLEQTPESPHKKVNEQDKKPIVAIKKLSPPKPFNRSKL